MHEIWNIAEVSIWRVSAAIRSRKNNSVLPFEFVLTSTTVVHLFFCGFPLFQQKTVMVHEMFAINWMQLCSWKLFWMHCAKMKNGFFNFQHSQEGKRWKLFGASEISLKRTLAHSSCNNFSSFCVYFRWTMAQTASGNLIVNYPNLLNTSFTFAFRVHENYAVAKVK